MKTKIILFVFIVINTMSLSAQAIKDPYVFKAGEEYNLFGDNINIREEPNTTSEIVAVLPITSKVKVLEKTDLTYNINGVDWSFYKIKSDSIVGYVTGGFLAINEVFSFQNKGLKLSVSKCGTSSYTYISEVYKQGENEYDGKTITKIITYPTNEGLIYRSDRENTEIRYNNSEKYYILISLVGTYIGGDIVNGLELEARSLIMIKFLKNNEHFISKKIIGRKEGYIEEDGVFNKINVPCFIERTDDTIIFGFEYSMEI